MKAAEQLPELFRRAPGLKVRACAKLRGQIHNLPPLKRLRGHYPVRRLARLAR